MRRGEVWVANLNPNRGAEMGKVRPVVVLQADELTTAGLETVVVLPLTSQVRTDLRHLRVTIPARDKLRGRCQVVIEQPRTLDRDRFGHGPLARLTPAELGKVERVVRRVLGIG